MPCSAPEFCQRRMYELIEGLQGVEVIADDFLILGYGDSQEEAIHSHEQNLAAFLQRCTDRGLKLSAEKVKLRLREVPFIGHIATDKGLCVDPAKIRAIMDMPPPTQVLPRKRLVVVNILKP